jgi:c-di-GMP-binding flagellar brake protein YcgR
MRVLEMTVRRRLGDRRGRARFEIIGQLWGSLELLEPLRLVNLSRGGALLETRLPLLRDSIQRLRLAVQGQTLDVQARVCHVAVLARGSTEQRYLVGFEFLALPGAVLEQIDRLVALNARQPPPATEA